MRPYESNTSMEDQELAEELIRSATGGERLMKDYFGDNPTYDDRTYH